jgi:Kef-type K+ transport system membrane component KefB
LLLQITIILVAARVLGLAFRRIGQPQVVGEMTAGVLLGPTLLGRIAPETFHAWFPSSSLEGLSVLSQVGLVLYMFAVGVKLRPPDVRGLVRPAIAASGASMLVPFVLGALLAVPLYSANSAGFPLLQFALFIGTAMSITALPVLARILAERNLLHTRVAAVAISCAAVDDVAAWCLLALIMAASAMAWLPMVTGLFVYVAVMVFLLRPLLRRCPIGFASALLLLLISSWVTDWLGVHALFGAFMAGLVMPVETKVPAGFESVTETLLLPLFFALTGLRTSIAIGAGAQFWFWAACLVAVAVAGKLFGCTLALRMNGLPWNDCLAVGTLVNARGLIELVLLNIGLERKIISPTVFAMMVLMALVTTFMTTPLLALIHRWFPLAESAEGRA